MTRSFIITATDTDAGKTVAAATLALGLSGRYWKPIQCGRNAAGRTDRDIVRALTALPEAHFLPETYCFSAALSPHRAAEFERQEINPEKIISDYKTHIVDGDDECLFIEGAGGLMVPITRELLQIDLFASLGAPIILVARTALGTINHTLLSLAAIRARGLPLAGLLFTGPENPDNIQTILDFAVREQISGVHYLGWLPQLPELNPQTIQTAYHHGIEESMQKFLSKIP